MDQIMDRRRMLGVVGTLALVAVIGVWGAGKTKAAAADCCCGDLCCCGADCGDVCDCCGPDCCGDTCCCDATASKAAAAKVVKEIGCCEDDGVSATVAKSSCCAATNAKS